MDSHLHQNHAAGAAPVNAVNERTGDVNLENTQLVPRMRIFGTTIFDEMSGLARKFSAVNLGQGFPDASPHSAILDAVENALRTGKNQYAPGPGIPELQRAIAAHQKRFYGQTYDPDTEIAVTFGATEALASAILGLVEPGEDVVMIDPAYDAYPALAVLAGARMHRVALTPPVYPKDGGIVEDGWTLDMDRLAEAITKRTRLLIINTPHNPTGTVFDRATLEQIAALAIANDVIVVSDEVYEHLVFDGKTHDSIVNIPGMRERTLMISSAGKTFSCTGWKTGWACAPEPLATAVKGIKQFLTYGGGTPLQHGVALGLSLDTAVFEHEANDLQRRRDFVVEEIAALGIPVTRSAATYFVTADFSSVGFDDAETFCRWAPEAIGVAAVPVSTFVQDKQPVKSLVRLAVCKADTTLEEGMARLKRGFAKVPS